MKNFFLNVAGKPFDGNQWFMSYVIKNNQWFISSMVKNVKDSL